MNFVWLSFSFRWFLMIFVAFNLFRYWHKPEQLLLLWGTLLPFSVELRIGAFALSLSEIVIVFFILSYLLVSLRDALFVPMQIEIYGMLFVSILGVFTSTLISSQIGFSIRHLVQSTRILLYCFSMVLVARCVKRSESLIVKLLVRILKAIVVSSVGGIVVFFLSGIIGTDILPLERTQPLFSAGISTVNPLANTNLYRAHFLNEPKGLAAWASIGLIIALFLKMAASNNSKKRFNLEIFFLIVATLISFSRGGLIQVSLVLVIYILFLPLSSGIRRNIADSFVVFLVVFLVLSFLLLSARIEGGLFQTMSSSTNVIDTLLETYDSAVTSYLKSNVSDFILAPGIAFVESRSRVFLPETEPWTFTSNYSLRRGAILSLIEYGMLGSIVLLLLIVNLLFKSLAKDRLAVSFFLASWFAFYLIQVEGGTLLFHRVVFGLLVVLTYGRSTKEFHF